MKRKSVNLGVSLPTCRCCGNYWRPPQGVNASAAYCKRCANERRAKATAALGLKQITPADLSGSFLLPRRFRSS